MFRAAIKKSLANRGIVFNLDGYADECGCCPCGPKLTCDDFNDICAVQLVSVTGTGECSCFESQTVPVDLELQPASPPDFFEYWSYVGDSGAVCGSQFFVSFLCHDFGEGTQFYIQTGANSFFCSGRQGIADQVSLGGGAYQFSVTLTMPPGCPCGGTDDTITVTLIAYTICGETTLCCAGTPVPDTLHVTLSDATGTCSCLNGGTFDITYDVGNSRWHGTSGSLCSNTLEMIFYCDGLDPLHWVGNISTVGCMFDDSISQLASDVTCNPFHFEDTATMALCQACSGTIKITITS